MPGRRIPAGELGSIQFAQLADGRVRARARMRDGAGDLVQLRALGCTQADALAQLGARARRHTLGFDEAVLTTTWPPSRSEGRSPVACRSARPELFLVLINIGDRRVKGQL
jgi:hypothetical protein